MSRNSSEENSVDYGEDEELTLEYLRSVSEDSLFLQSHAKKVPSIVTFKLDVEIHSQEVDEGQLKAKPKESSASVDPDDKLPEISQPEPLPPKRKLHPCFQEKPATPVTPATQEREEFVLEADNVESGVKTPQQLEERKSIKRSSKYSSPPVVMMTRSSRGTHGYKASGYDPSRLSSFISSMKIMVAEPGQNKIEYESDSSSDDPCQDAKETKYHDRPDSKKFTTPELKILCLKLREQQRLLRAMMVNVEELGGYPPPSLEAEGIDLGEDVPCEFPTEDVGSSYQFDDEVVGRTDLLVLLVKSGPSYQTEDHRFRFRRTDSIMDLKLRVSQTLAKRYYLLEVRDRDGKIVTDPVPFSCQLSVTNDVEPGYLQIQLLPNVTLEETEVIKYHVFLVPDLEIVRSFIGSYSGQQRDMIIQKLISPQFLGGFKDWVNCKEFRNATTQTCQIDCQVYEKFQESRWKEKWTQIFQVQHACVQTPEDTSTQMTFVNVYRSNADDKVVVPSGAYITSNDYRALIRYNVVTVQKYLRRWYARRLVEKRLATKLCIEKAEKEQLDFSYVEKERAALMQRRLNPRTKDDFDLLYVDLEAWRLEETRKIVSSMKGAERKAALAQLLDDESKLIKCIGDVMKDIEDERLNLILQKFMDKVSKPKMKRDSKGLPLSIDHWYRVESRHMLAIYKTMDFNTKFMKQPYERMSVLSNVKNYLQQKHSEAITDLKLELSDLIERETIMMMKGVRVNRLMGLRKRVNHLFYLLLKRPEFNPAVAHFNETLHDKVYLKTITHCISCNRGLPVSNFPNSVQPSLSPRTCRECQRTNNRACKRADYSSYQSILWKLRKDERDYDDGARLAFFMQLKDVRYLVNCIWHMRSIISKNSDLTSLVLVRWQVDKEWSPWNSILVTLHEALLHTRSIDVQKTYSDELLFSIHLKHTQARHDFAKLLTMRAELPNHKRHVLPSLMSCPEWARRASGMKKATEKKAIVCESINLTN